MKARQYLPGLKRALTLVLIAGILVPGCKKEENPPPEDDCASSLFGCETYDVDASGIPRFVNFNYIELDSIASISKFRSGVGHDYSDDFESCRSMKHYFAGPGMTTDTTVKIFSPVNGKITFLQQEWTGMHIQIKCNEQPAFFFDIFHVNLASPLSVGDNVSANQFLGNHSSDQTLSDIAVAVHTPADGPNNAQPTGWKLISWFDVISDTLFQAYVARGITSRDSCRISKADRDADYLDCSGPSWGVDPGAGTISNWMNLN